MMCVFVLVSVEQLVSWRRISLRSPAEKPLLASCLHAACAFWGIQQLHWYFLAKMFLFFHQAQQSGAGIRTAPWSGSPLCGDGILGKDMA